MNNDIVVIDQQVQETELTHIEARIERTMRHAWIETAIDWDRIKQEKLYKKVWGTWENYCPERWNRTHSSIDKQIIRAKEAEEIRKFAEQNWENFPSFQLPSTISHATALSKLKDPEERAIVWKHILDTSNGTGITAKKVEAEVIRFQESQNKNWYTLEEFDALAHPDAELTFMCEPSIFVSVDETKTMNQTNDNIEWAAWSWNPVTGCLHNCDYCYARDIANRFYPQEFQPSFIPERLFMPANTRPIPPRWNGDTGHTNVFTCSMADLFGKWVSKRWIQSVIDTATANPQWNFLFLTKFPIRMAEFTYPANVWLGTTVDRQHAVNRAESAFRQIKESGFDGICWLSCEPMLERLSFNELSMFDWVVMGGSSKSTQTPEYKPPFEDVLHLYEQARDYACQVYMKTNLLGERVREYPK